MLKVKDLTIAYPYGKTLLPAVRDFSLQIKTGQTYGLVGESGSGKTTVSLAIMRYPDAAGQIIHGEIYFDGKEMTAAGPEELRRLWGRDITYVPQDPMSSLNPSIRVGEQVAEVLRHHLSLSPAAATQRSIDLLKMVRLPDPARVARSYPHEISGGMQQRVLLALALSTEPKLLVLDEPTTSLDVTTQAAILDLFTDLIREHQTAVLYITHNLGVVARVCDRVAVLYAGELVEDTTVENLFQRPLHPYTRGLLASVPGLGRTIDRNRLQAIPGQIPSLAERKQGCVFAPRCSLALEKCFQERPTLDTLADGQQVRCHRWPELLAGDISIEVGVSKRIEPQSPSGVDNVLDLQSVRVDFPLSQSLREFITRQPRRAVQAVQGIDLALKKGQTWGLVGESGSGKTTVARTVIGLVERSGGNIELTGVPLHPKLSKRSLDALRSVQYIFQNPEEALNPYLTIGETLQRPFITLLGLTSEEAKVSVYKVLEAVRLPAEYFHRLPHQLSGGEKQRVAIARAFASSPELMLADEPVSALDVSVQASILNLMRELQVQNDSTMLFISHDLSVVSYLADHVAVVYAGQLMEIAETADLFEPPYHPYTEALISAIPLVDPYARPTMIRLAGDVPNQIDKVSGCPFHPRCPRYLGDICREEIPAWQETENGTRIFCHIPVGDLKAQQERFVDVAVAGEG